MATKEPKDFSIIKFDTHLTERFLRDGRLDRTELDAWLKKLPNEEGNFEYLAFSEEDITDTSLGSLTFTAD